MILQTSNPRTQVHTQAATSAMPATSTQYSGPLPQQDYSCVLCKSRKVRCGRGNPCTGCVRAGVNCVPGSRRPYKRRKRAHYQSGSLKNADASARSRDIYSAPLSSLEIRPAQEGSRHHRQAPTFGQYVQLSLHCQVTASIYYLRLLGLRVCNILTLQTEAYGPA